MNTPLNDIKGTPVFDVDVGWTDDPQGAFSEISLFQRHQYLRQWIQLPEVIGDAQNPADPGPPAVISFPESPDFVLQDIYDGVAGSDANVEEILNELLYQSSTDQLNPGQIKAIDRLLLSMQIAGVIDGVEPAIPQFPPGDIVGTPVQPFVPPAVVMGSGSLTDALNVWRDLSETADVMADGINQGQIARIRNRSEQDQFAATSLQHAVRFHYVQHGNDIMFNAMADLHDSLELVEETMQFLNNVGRVLNTKEPERAKLNLIELLGMNRNSLDYLVDQDNEGAQSYASYLDDWERRQFDRDLQRVVLDTGDENTGTISQVNFSFGLTSPTVTQTENGGVGDGDEDDFDGTVSNLPDDFEIVPGTFEVRADNGDIVEIFTDNGDGTLTSNLGNEGEIDYEDGDWEVEFRFPPKDGAPVEVEYKHAKVFRRENVELTLGNGSEDDFSGKTPSFPILEGSLSVTDGFEVFTDDGNGNLVGNLGGTGSVDYDTGEWDVGFATPPPTGASVRFTFDHTQIPVVNQSINSGTGVEDDFEGVLVPHPITEGSVVITDGFETFTDDGNGNLIGDKGGSGEIDYDDGEYEIEFNTPPYAEQGNIKATFTHQVLTPFEVDDEEIAEAPGGTQNISAQTAHSPVVPGTVKVKGDGETFRDQGNGQLIGDDGGTGTVDYVTGQINLFFVDAPDNGDEIEADYEVFTGVPNDDETLLVHLGAKVTSLIDRLPDGDLKDKLVAIQNDLLGNTFVPTETDKVFDLNSFIADFRPDQEGDYQRNLSAAQVAAGSLNDSEKEELRRRMFEFEEFYKSASAVIQKINQILERIAQGISR